MFPIATGPEDFKIVPILSYANANSDRTSEVIDTKGYGWTLIGVHFAAINDSVTEQIYLKSSDTATDENTLSSGSNVSTSAQSIVGTADNGLFYMWVKNNHRYLQLTVDKDATNPSAEDGFAILMGAKIKPVTQATGNTTVGEGTGAVAGESVGLETQGSI
jgi:hypothetical protein